MKNLTMVLSETYIIQNRESEVHLVLERLSDKYMLSAITETGFDLCDCSFGTLKRMLKCNTRLRSEKSLLSEMADILYNVDNSLHNQDFVYIFPQVVKAKISGTEVHTRLGDPNLSYFNANCIHSVESGETISWYAHDVYNQGNIILYFYRDGQGAPRFKAHEKDLYDYGKLRELYNSDRFRNKDFAFFFYNEVRRLLGEPIEGHPKQMSGLFK